MTNILQSIKQTPWVVSALILMVFLVFLILPAYDRHQELKNTYAKQTQLLQWMMSNTPASKQSNPETAQSSGNLLADLEQVAATLGLSSSITNMRQLNDREVKLWLENIEFEDFLELLEKLHQTGHIQFNNLHIQQTPRPGFVNLEIIFLST